MTAATEPQNKTGTTQRGPRWWPHLRITDRRYDDPAADVADHGSRRVTGHGVSWRLLQGLLLVSLSALSSIGAGWAFASLLLVALGAGAAGAFATVDKQISVALPGVAVSVAVVPPLAAAGVLLGRGQPELARGGALLFTTNLVGIVLMAAVVFLFSGLVPRQNFSERRPQILASPAAAAAGAVAVAPSGCPAACWSTRYPRPGPPTTATPEPPAARHTPPR